MSPRKKCNLVLELLMALIFTTAFLTPANVHSQAKKEMKWRMQSMFPASDLSRRGTRSLRTETFKCVGSFVIDDNWKFTFSISAKANRGDSTCSKKECLKSNVPTAAKLPWCLSSLQQASRFTVRHASRNTRLSSPKMAI